MVTTLHKLLDTARRRSFAIPAFNVTDLETVQAVLDAAVQMRSPVIIQTSEKAMSYAGARTLYALMRVAAEDRARKIPVVIHLDHGKHFAVVSQAVRLGYPSVHMDASEKPGARNVALTKRAVALGHRHGITVQGELGYLLGYEGMTKIRFTKRAIEKYLTDPLRAAEFVRKTGVDTLAVAVGTAHGVFKGKEFIDVPRLRAIARATRVPLVLHGGSGLSARDLKTAIRNGVRIVNIDTWLRLAFMKGLSASVKRRKPDHVDIREPLGAARLTMMQEAIRVIRLLGSAGKA